MRAEPMTPRLLPYTPERDVYLLLGVSSSASTDEIAAACRRLALAFHPDHNRSGRATEEMQVVNAVRTVMSDPEWRAVYDRERHRFHASLARPRRPTTEGWSPPVRWASPPPPVTVSRPVTVSPPATVAPTAPSTFERYLRAALIGMRSTLAGLAPARCRGCRIVVEPGDAYCAACGTPLLTGS
jgi:curved DNA-binding protein CbpA